MESTGSFVLSKATDYRLQAAAGRLKVRVWSFLASGCSLSPVPCFRRIAPPMFDKLTERLQGVMESLRGRGRLTDENISDTLRQVRMALLEADVALPVVKTFIESIRGKVV